MIDGIKKRGKNCIWVGNNVVVGILIFIFGEGRRVDVFVGWGMRRGIMGGVEG